MSGEYVEGSFYFYAPNKGAPVFFAIAFLASGLYHAYQCIHYNSWRITGLYVTCSALFAAGFIVREIGAFNYDDLILFIVSICLIYAAPPLLELSNYNILGRVLYYVPHLSPIHPGRVISTFAMISVVIESLNGTGASMTANQSLTQERQETGRTLLKASLIIQIVVLILFLWLAIVFHLRIRRARITHSGVYNVLYTLYASATLLTARTVYRTVEYFSIAEFHYGKGVEASDLSPAIRYEWYFYVFEAVLMLANNVLLNVRHPRKYLPKSTKTCLAEDGVTEITGAGYKDTRPFLVTVLDPFDLAGLFEKKNKEKKVQDVKGDSDSSARKRDVEAAV